MAAPIIGRAFARTLPSTSASRCLRTPFSRSRTLNHSTRTAIRSFAVSTRAYEKRYTEDHEWVELSSDGSTATIGISEYAAKALGDVVFVELPTADLEVKAGESIGAVESVKSASEILTPISGVITEANNVLEDKPATINQSPEADGWIAKIKIADSVEMESLMDATAYQKFTEEAGDH